MMAKYISGKYNPFKINEIYFDKRAGFWKMIPKNYNKYSFLGFVLLSCYHIMYCLGAVIEYSNYTPNISKVRFYDELYQKSYSGLCSQIIADFILHNYSMNYLMSVYQLLKWENYYIIENSIDC